MRKFPAYTLDALLQEKAVRFYALVEYSLRLDAELMQELITIISFPYLSEQSRTEILNNYANVSRDMINYKADMDDYSGIKRLKDIM